MTKIAIPKTRCDKCGGSGIATLPDHLAVTWMYVRQNPNKTVAEIHKGSRVNGGVTLTNQRLNDLADLHLVTRERFGKAYKYTATKTK